MFLSIISSVYDSLCFLLLLKLKWSTFKICVCISLMILSFEFDLNCRDFNHVADGYIADVLVSRLSPEGHFVFAGLHVYGTR